MATRVRSSTRALLAGLCICLCGQQIQSSLAMPSSLHENAESIPPDGIHVLDGSYVLDMGRVYMNITNFGLIGSQFTNYLPYSDSPSCNWPGGSANEYLWGASLWVGAKVDNEIAVTTGLYERELRPAPDITSTIYEAKQGRVIRPVESQITSGIPGHDDDRDGNIDEEILNGKDDDNDGLIDEDFCQIGDQMFTCTMHDNLPLISEIYLDHLPMDIEVVQRAASWAHPQLENIIGLDFTITNIGLKDLTDIYLAFFTDCDIQSRASTYTDSNDKAGFYSGFVKSTNDIYYKVDVGYMYDGANTDPLPGWIGVVTIFHPRDFRARSAPRYPSVETFQIFSSTAGIYQDGEPVSDSERYALMSAPWIDPNTHENYQDDLKFMVSSGPFESLNRGESLEYRLAIVLGNSKQEMLSTAARACQLALGDSYNLDNDYSTGYSSRETLICLGDLHREPGQRDPLFGMFADYGDRSCIPDFMVDGLYPIATDDLYLTPEGRECIWVNTDNCEECSRVVGHECTLENVSYRLFGRMGGCNAYPDACTGLYGRETKIPWTNEESKPLVSPDIRIQRGDQQVEIFWNNRSEILENQPNTAAQFESYRVWHIPQWTRPAGSSPSLAPGNELWGMIADFDIVNNYPDGIIPSGELVPYGLNTGLEPASYTPACLNDPSYDGLAEVMAEIVANDRSGNIYACPKLRNGFEVIPSMESLIRWESEPAVLDTFFSVVDRLANPDEGITEKKAVKYYHFLDTKLHNGITTYFSVTATGLQIRQFSELARPFLYEVQEPQSNNYLVCRPAPTAQTAQMREMYGTNIYVYPDPATNKSLAENDSQPSSWTNPGGIHITFNNLPAANNTIKIFTLAGDLVKTIEHNGTTGNGAATWNLYSTNLQSVCSGIYLYSVHSNDPAFKDYIGKFTVVR